MSAFYFPMPIDQARTHTKIHDGELIFVGYIRVSSPAQAGDHLSLREQEDRLRIFVDQQGGRLIAVEQDICTGRNTATKRPGLTAALNLCAARKTRLVIPSVDRLARSLDVIEPLSVNGVEVLSVLEGAVSRENRLVPLLERAQTYSASISANSRAAHARSRAAGKKLGNLRNLVAHRGRGTANNQARSEEKIEMLVEVLQKHGEVSSMSLRDTAGWLNARNLKNRRSRYEMPVAWSPGSLRKPLSEAKRRFAVRRSSKAPGAK